MITKRLTKKKLRTKGNKKGEKEGPKIIFIHIKIKKYVITKKIITFAIRKILRKRQLFCTIKKR